MLNATLTVRVAQKNTEALDIDSFELVAVDGQPLPAFSAGSHVDVHLPGGLVRQYSLCNSSGENHRYQIAVLKDANSRGGSKAMHEQVKVGDALQISAPKNHFMLAHEAKRHVLLAGGIGVTPILCMAERLTATGADFEMHYCTRSVERTAFRARMAETGLAAKVAFYVDDAVPAQKLDIAKLLAKPEPDVHLYACGPKGFMNAVLETARSSGWNEAQLHYEFFGADVSPVATDETFEVQVASSGQIVTVGKEQTILDALAAAGVEILSSCEQGVCGTCLTRVIEGVPDHRDMYLTPEEQAANDQFLPCCSRSKSARLVLDI
ncbi:MAG: PDR/VanB family oxidoreductase [Polaromonas sp.]|nr:PDR/VanB family oxidoreductase [Polaromonas sp.]